MKIKAIACVAEDYGIGKNNDLLFHIKDDMKRFTALTTNAICCMGENTLLSFPKSKPLKNRVNVVLCPDGHEYANCICIHSFDKMVDFVKLMGAYFPVYIIGGAMFYKSMLPYCDSVLLTKVQANIAGATAFFPNMDEELKNNNFKIVQESDVKEENNLKYKFVEYNRI